MENLSALVQRAQHGDSAAEASLFEWLRPYVSGLAHGRHGLRSADRDADASDLTQATMFRIAQSLATYRGEGDGQFKTWVATIVRNLAADQARRRPLPHCTGIGVGSGGIAANVVADESTPSERLMRLEQSARLQQALESLPVDQRNAVRWRYIEGCSFNEVARRLDRTADAATQLVRRGIVRLNETLAAGSSRAGTSSTSRSHGPVAPLSPGAG